MHVAQFLWMGWIISFLVISNIEKINRGSYMNAHVLLNLLNESGKKIRCDAFPSILSAFPNEFKNSIIQEHECKITFII